MADAIQMFRWIILVLSVPVVIMSARGFLVFARRQTAANGASAIGFLMAASSGSFQIRFLLGDIAGAPPGPSVLVSQSMTAAGLVAAMVILARIRAQRYDRLELIGHHIDVAHAISELDALSPDRAQAMARECRRQIATLIMEKTVG